MATPTIPQRSGIELNAEFQSIEGAAALPSTAHWRLTCETTGRVLQDWTTAALSTETSGGSVTRVSVTVEIPGTLTALCDASSQRELKVCTIVADKDTAREYSEDFPFYVKRGGR